MQSCCSWRRATNISGDPHNPGDSPQPPATDRLHPRVNVIVIALAAWFALAVWSFAGAGIIDYLLFIVSGFVFVAVVLPLILSRVGQPNSNARRNEQPSLRDWAAWNYETWTGRLSGAQAATQIILPLAAAAVGMTVIGLIFLASRHAAA